MAKSNKEKKIFILDTSVILYESNSILNFDEHDIGIPITVLEELDNFKKGNDIKNFEAREFIRLWISWPKTICCINGILLMVRAKEISES